MGPGSNTSDSSNIQDSFFPNVSALNPEYLEIGLPIYSLDFKKVVYIPPSIGVNVFDHLFSFKTHKVFPQFDIVLINKLPDEGKVLKFNSIIRLQREGVWYLTESIQEIQLVKDYTEIDFFKAINVFMQQSEMVKFLYKNPLPKSDVFIHFFIDYDQRSDEQICIDKNKNLIP